MHNRIKSSVVFWREVEQRTAADRDRKSRINSAVEITWSCLHHLNTKHHKLSRHLRMCLICFFHFVCLINPPPLARSESSGDPLLCSHIHCSWISTDFILGRRADKVRLTWTFVSVRCMSESSYTFLTWTGQASDYWSFNQAICAVHVNLWMHQTSCQPHWPPAASRVTLNSVNYSLLMLCASQMHEWAGAVYDMQHHVEKHKPGQLSLYGFYCK